MTPHKIIVATTGISTGGLGSYLVTLVDGLKSRDWDVHLLVTNVRGDYFAEMSKHHTCHDMSGIPLSPGKVFKAADLANSVMPDIILSNNCALMQYASPLIDPGVKKISVLHSDDSRFYAISALFPERFFRWIAPTAGLAAEFQKFVEPIFYPRIRVIPHGVTRSRFFPAKNRDDGPARRILFVGFLGESKGADMLPDIFQRIARVNPESFLTIIGDGPLKGELQAEFAKRALNEKIAMRGPMSPDETAEVMRGSHMLLLPTNLEGFGMVIVEAMMSGVVPIVSRLAGITDQLIQDGETGILVAPRNTDGFVDAAIRIQNDPVLYRAMSEKAVKASSAYFSDTLMIDRYETLFAEPEDRDPAIKLSRPAWYTQAMVQYLRKRWR